MFLILRDVLWQYPESVLRVFKHMRLLLTTAIIILISVGALFIVKEHVPAIYYVFWNQKAGEYREGLIGSLSQINPLVTSNNLIEEDVKAAIYNKLVRIDSHGNVYPELSSTWNITNEGKTYTFFLRDDVNWHGGETFSADDVLFTYDLLKGKDAVGILGKELEEVKVNKVDDYTVQFILPSANALFMELINVYILPEHILQTQTFNQIAFSDETSNIIGTGPFSFHSRDEEQVVLLRNKEYFEGEPEVKRLVFRFFPTEKQALNSLRSGDIQAVSNITSAGLDMVEDYSYLSTLTTDLSNRTRVLFLNSNENSILRVKDVRRAISAAIDKERIAELFPGVTIATGAIPVSSWAYNPDAVAYDYDVEEAQELLDKTKWLFPENKDNPTYRLDEGKEMIITLTYWDNEINDKIAQYIQEDLQKVGVKLLLDPQPFNDLSEQVVPTRSFEMLLFEVSATIDPDRYAFWHSSNVKFPGLNITGYKNERIDILLERARTISDLDKRKEYYNLFQRYLNRDVPAVFLYHPVYRYIYDSNRLELPQNIDMSSPYGRFDTINEWKLK